MTSITFEFEPLGVDEFEEEMDFLVDMVVKILGINRFIGASVTGSPSER